MHAYGHLRRAPAIPVRGKHLDTLEPWDVGFIAFNKLATTVFTYHLLTYLWHADTVGAFIFLGAAGHEWGLMD